MTQQIDGFEQAAIEAQAERDAAREERDALREALCDAMSQLTSAASAYRTFARRSSDLNPKAEIDPFFRVRAEEFEKAAHRARVALGEKA